MTDSLEHHFSVSPTLEEFRQKLSIFAKDRDWNQYHTPRNLVLALVGEVGELSEIFQWKGEVKVGVPDFTQKEREHLGQELSDVLLYLIRLADRCHIDLPKMADEKIKLNAIKYPAKLVLGSSKKYNEYTQEQSPVHTNNINCINNMPNINTHYYWVVTNTEVNVNINGATSLGIIKNVRLEEIIQCCVYLKDARYIITTTADKLSRVYPSKKDKVIVVDIGNKYRGQIGIIICFDKRNNEICSVRLDRNPYEIKEMHIDNLAKYSDENT